MIISPKSNIRAIIPAWTYRCEKETRLLVILGKFTCKATIVFQPSFPPIGDVFADWSIVVKSKPDWSQIYVCVLNNPGMISCGPAYCRRWERKTNNFPT